MTVKIKKEPFPEQLRGKVRGFSVSLKNDAFLVMIDSTRAQIAQRHSLGHELAHIFRGHFESGLSLSYIERDANRHAWEYYRLYRDGLLEGVTA